MMNQIFSRKGIVFVVLPLFAVFLQLVIRYAMEMNFNSIGITLAAIGLGQLIPYLHFEHFLTNKVFTTQRSVEYLENGVVISYFYRRLQGAPQADQIHRSADGIFVAAIFALVLFIVTILLGLIDSVTYQLIFGMFTCAFSWYFTFK